MDHLLDYPLIVFLLSFCAMCLSVVVGALVRRGRDQEKSTHENYAVILAASLTLLGLIIGFSFSMATNRYDQRKNYEEAEANAIGTEYIRADLLPATKAERVRLLLRKYTDQRILFYEHAISSSSRRSMPKPPNCRLSCGLWSWNRPNHGRHRSLL